MPIELNRHWIYTTKDAIITFDLIHALHWAFTFENYALIYGSKKRPPWQPTRICHFFQLNEQYHLPPFPETVDDQSLYRDESPVYKFEDSLPDGSEVIIVNEVIWKSLCKQFAQPLPPRETKFTMHLRLLTWIFCEIKFTISFQKAKCIGMVESFLVAWVNGEARPWSSKCWCPRSTWSKNAVCKN